MKVLHYTKIIAGFSLAAGKPQCRVILSVRHMFVGSYKFRSDNTLIVIGMCIIFSKSQHYCLLG